jgi:hypothetical protein
MTAVEQAARHGLAHAAKTDKSGFHFLISIELRAAKAGRNRLGRFILRGWLRSHLRMTDHDLCSL